MSSAHDEDATVRCQTLRLYRPVSEREQQLEPLSPDVSDYPPATLETNDTDHNAKSVSALPGNIAAMNLEVPVTRAMDNARNRKCNRVAAVASQLPHRDTYPGGLFKTTAGAGKSKHPRNVA